MQSRPVRRTPVARDTSAAATASRSAAVDVAWMSVRPGRPCHARAAPRGSSRTLPHQSPHAVHGEVPVLVQTDHSEFIVLLPPLERRRSGGILRPPTGATDELAAIRSARTPVKSPPAGSDDRSVGAKVESARRLGRECVAVRGSDTTRSEGPADESLPARAASSKIKGGSRRTTT